MLMTAGLIGVGVYILFRDLPEDARKTSIKHSWLPHIGIFALLFFLHGGSAEGAAMAGIATLIFRWMMPWAAPREKKNKDDSPGITSESIREYLHTDGTDAGIAVITSMGMAALGMTIMYFAL